MTASPISFIIILEVVVAHPVPIRSILKVKVVCNPFPIIIMLEVEVVAFNS